MIKTIPSFVYGLLSLLLTLGAAAPARAQTPAWQVPLLINTTTNNSTSIAATATDGSGNIYVAGYFTGTAFFGGVSLISAGSADIFVAKYDPVAGAFVWAQKAGGTGGEGISALAVSGSSVYVSGAFTGTSRFGATSLSNAGLTDLFVAKLTDAGSSASWAWAVRAGGTGYDYGFALAASGSTLYLGGRFQTQVNFGTVTVSSTGGSDAYVARLTDMGTTATFNWVQRVGGSGDDEINFLALNGPAIYASGTFAGTMTLGSTTLTSTGAYDGFVAKLTDNTTAPAPGWVRQITAAGRVHNTTLTCNGPAVYVAVSYEGTATIGSNSLPNTNQPSATDMLVARINDTGAANTVAWAQKAGGGQFDFAYALAVRGPNVYLACTVNYLASFGTLTTDGFGTDAAVAKLIDNGTSARFAWVQRAIGSYEEGANSLLLLGSTVYVGGFFHSPISFDDQFITATGTIIGFLAGLPDATLTATAAPTPRLALTFYPNPARTTVHVPTASAATILTLTDGLGRVVRTALGNSLPVQGLAPGLYLLRAATPGQPVRTGKLLVE